MKRHMFRVWANAGRLLWSKVSREILPKVASTATFYKYKRKEEREAKAYKDAVVNIIQDSRMLQSVYVKIRSCSHESRFGTERCVTCPGFSAPHDQMPESCGWSVSDQWHRRNLVILWCSTKSCIFTCDDRKCCVSETHACITGIWREQSVCRPRPTNSSHVTGWRRRFIWGDPLALTLPASPHSLCLGIERRELHAHTKATTSPLVYPHSRPLDFPFPFPSLHCNCQNDCEGYCCWRWL